jgi:hypothetical protein
VYLDAEADLAGGCCVGELMDIAHEGFLVLLLAVVAADRGVHDVDAHPLAKIERPQTERQAVLGGEVGVTGERDRHEAEPVHHPLDPAERLRIGFQRHVLRPAAHRGELHEFVARRGDPLERLLQTVGMIGVRVPAKPVPV